MISSRDNNFDGAELNNADYQITDWEAIALAPDVAAIDAPPRPRAGVRSGAGGAEAVGQPVCHFCIVTGETCGTIATPGINGWFTATNGVVSQKGDLVARRGADAADGRAVIIGLFTSTWGQLPAAVSFESTGQQIIEATAIQPTNSNTGIETVFTRTARRRWHPASSRRCDPHSSTSGRGSAHQFRPMASGTRTARTCRRAHHVRTGTELLAARAVTGPLGVAGEIFR